jgi:serine/threonine protein kinase
VTTFTPPEHFDDFRMVRPLGRGAMGEVWLGHDRRLDRPVAIKFISGMADDAARARFLVEARAIARLSHPNVVTIFRAGEILRRPYLVSELIVGTTLSELPRPVPFERLLPIAVGLARGLATAHRRGVLHRDV